MNGFHVDIILNDIKVNEKSIQKLNIRCLLVRCVFRDVSRNRTLYTKRKKRHCKGKAAEFMIH